MEVVIKGLLGALVSVAIHYSITSKHAYLSGLIVAAPIFALFAHVTLASATRTADLQGSVHFHLLSMIPTGLYLCLVWWLTARINVWVALLFAAFGWCIAAFILILVWNKSAEAIVNLLDSRFTAAMILGALTGSVLAVGNRLYQLGSFFVRLRSGITSLQKRPQLLAKPLAGIAVAVICATFLLNTQTEIPGERHACVLLQSALTLGPGDAASQEIQNTVMAKYVTLAKEANFAGDIQLSDVYTERARAMLFGSWVDTNALKPKFC